MTAPQPKPEIEILHKTLSQVPDEKGQLQPYTHIVYRDEQGQIGTLTLKKKDPTDADIAAAVKKQREEQKARKPHKIAL